MNILLYEIKQRKNGVHILPFVLLFVFMPYKTVAQQSVSQDFVEKDNNLYTIKQHSAKKALWKSAIIPGWGQIYNKQTWKLGVIYGAAAVVTYLGVNNYNNAQKFKTEYINRNNGNTVDLLPDYANYPDENIYNLYQVYEKNFQLSIIAGVAIYALNLIDAYCYGHLFDFQINDDLTLRFTPAIEYTNVGMGFTSGMKLQITF